MGTATIERFAQLIDLDAPPVYLDGGDPRMRPAVAITAALRSAAASTAPAPLSDTARLAIRERLVAAATTTAATPELGVAARVTRAAESGQRRAKDAGRKVSRRMSTLVGSVMIVTSVAGVGVATARALPGSPFYDLKRATEAIQLWVTSGDAGKGQRHLEFARTRMAEAAKLGPNSPYLASTLKAMDSETRDASSDLMEAYKDSGSLTPLTDLVTFAREQYVALTKLGATLPAKLRSEAAYSATLLAGVSQQVSSVANGLCHACAGETPPLGGVGPIVTPSVTPDPQPTSTKPTATKPTAAPTPTSKPSTSASKPPTDVLPTLPPLLNNKNGKAITLPTLSPLPLLSSLAQLLGR